MDASLMASVPGFPGYYATPNGEIWSAKRGRMKKMTLMQGNHGYLSVEFTYGSRATRKRYLRLVHRIVLEAFVGPCPLGMEACHHPDPSKTNCRLENLSWGTPSENNTQKLAHGTLLWGEKSPLAKLKTSDVHAIRSSADSLSTLARRYGVAITTVSQVKRGLRWKHLKSQEKEPSVPPPEKRVSSDLDVKYRPRTLDEVVGQPEAVRTIRAWREVPRCVLLHGFTGCGKSTLASIVAHEFLGAAPDNLWDRHVINCGIVDEPKNKVREVKAQMTALPMTAKRRVFIFDEIQEFVRSQGAQSAVLDVFEHPPPHVQFFLCTTDPKKLNKAVLGRATHVEVRPIPQEDLVKLLMRVAAAEGIPLDLQFAGEVAAGAEGSARIALKRLEKVAGIADPAERAAALGRNLSEENDSFGIVKALLPWKGTPSWPAVAAALDAAKKAEEEPEGLRHMILAAARSMLMRAKSAEAGVTAYKAIRCLSEPLFDRNSGNALLAAGCYQICYGGK